MRSIPQEFYRSKEWRDCRAAYFASHSLCERCKEKGLIVPAEIIHHKIYLTEQTYKDPKISLNFDNLEAVCRDCHNKEHGVDRSKQRWVYEDGELKIISRD